LVNPTKPLQQWRIEQIYFPGIERDRAPDVVVDRLWPCVGIEDVIRR
jgi:hypothetical protein